MQRLKILCASDKHGGMFLHLFVVDGANTDLFHPYPDSLVARGPLSIPNYKTIEPKKLHTVIQSKYGLWANSVNFDFQYKFVDPLFPFPGHFYERVFRPSAKTGKSWAEQNYNQDYNIVLRQQILRISREIDQICEVVWPEEENFKSYGIAIRNLLILICTEIESVLRGILKHNDYSSKSHLTMKDYVKLQDVLKLQCYSINFPNYPNIPSISAFTNWDYDNPTQSLSFYEAYNSVKHDRESHLKDATLEQLFYAFAGLIIVSGAQMGLELMEAHPEFRSIFSVAGRPGWNANEVYICDNMRNVFRCPQKLCGEDNEYAVI